MHRALPLLVACLLPAVAHAGGFGSPRPLTVRAPQPTTDTLGFEVGARVDVAPIKAVAKDRIRKARQDNPELEPVFELLREVDIELVRDADVAAIKEQLRALEGLTDEQRDAIEQVPEDEATRQQVIAVLEIFQDKEEAIAFAVRPWLRANFSGAMLTVEVPVAGFKLDDDTTFALGNVNLDLSLAHRADAGVAEVAFGYGLHAYLPTGTERANALAFTDLLTTPAWLHEYLTPSVYATVGVDLPFLTLAAHGEIVPMFAVRGEVRRELMMYARYGFGAQLHLLMLVLGAEISGTTSVKDAAPLESLYLAGGLDLDLGILQAGLHAQLPLSDAGAVTSGGLQSEDLGSPSEWNVIARVSVGF